MGEKYCIFIAYEFPPLQVGGVYRTLGFVNKLKGTGIIPIVITLDNDSIAKTSGNLTLDQKLLDNLNDEALVFRVPSRLNLEKQSSMGKAFDIIGYPNGIENKYWEENVLKQIASIIDEYDPFAVFCTAPPFSVVDLAAKLSKKYNLPLVLDLRDAWSNWFTAPYFSYLHFWYKRHRERKHIKLADKIVVTSKQTIADFITLNKINDKSKFVYIPNGFDGELLPWQGIDNTKKKFKIGYVGSFYYDPVTRDNLLKPWYRKKRHHILQYVPNLQDWKYRSPFFFFRAIKALKQQNSDLFDKVEIHFIGKQPDWLQKMIHDFQLNQSIFLHGVKSREESIEFQRNVDCLLITSAKVINGQDYSIAGKTFEYFQNQKPILAFVADGAQKEILQQSGMALVMNPDEPFKAAHQLELFFNGHLNLNPNINFIKEHSRTNCTMRLVELLETVTRKR
jgi:hypothetical protein